MKTGLKAILATLLALVGLETLAERLDFSKAAAEPREIAERPGSNGRED